jgi:hypothetical protein
MLDASAPFWTTDAFKPELHKRGGDPKNPGRFSQMAGSGYKEATAKFNKETGGHLSKGQAAMDPAPLDQTKWPKWLREAVTAEGKGITQPTFYRSQAELRAAGQADPPKEGRGLKAIRIAKNPNDPVYATGVDTQGRWQPVYNPNFKKSGSLGFRKGKAGAEAKGRGLEKWERIGAIRKEFPALVKENAGYAANPASLAKKMKHGSPAIAKELTDVQRVQQEMAIRVGGQETKAAKEARGLVDLQAQHVKIRPDDVSHKTPRGATTGGGFVHLEFWGKKHVWQDLVVRDPQIKKDLLERAKGGGAKPLWPKANYQLMLEYSKILDDGKFINHDYRGRLGSDMAAERIKKMPVPKNPKDYIKAQLAVATEVSKALGNKPTESLKSYIDPSVWKQWRTSAGVV